MPNKSIVLSFATAALVMTACNGGSDGNGSCTASAKSLSSKSVSAIPVSAFSKSEAAYLENKDGSSQLKKLASHIPHTMVQFSDQGKKEETSQIPITISLNLNNPAELAQELSEMYRSGSPSYHQFMTPEEFRNKYAPTDKQIEDVKAYLISQGIVPSSVDDNKLLIHATGSVAALNSSFHTEIHGFKDSGGNSYFAPAYELQSPSELPIQAVVGVQNFTHPHPHAIQKSTPLASGPSSGVTASQIRSAYNVPTSVNGAGETLAVFELDGYTASDLSGYESAFGIPNVPLENILVDSANGAAGGGAAEVTLDIELMTAIAPGASKILVYEGPNSDQGTIDTYAKIANDNRAKEISTSWGTSEDSASSSVIQTENTIFMQMAAQGQSIYSAAGDSGADDNGSSLSIDDPSGQPYMVAVGGTSLSINSDGSYQSETTWFNNSSSGGGGGVSKIWSQPSWQNGVAGTAASLGSTSMRNIPDVSLESDINKGYAIYYQGGWSVWGGTSCAAPLWAAFTALVNQQRVGNGLGDLGFANPSLYQIGKSGNFASDFHDIADNSTNGHYPAVAGYDDATGWGSFNGQGLFQDLTQAGLPTTGSGCN